MKPVHWIGSSREDLKDFPKEARREMGFALQAAQSGDKHPSAKPLRGFGGAGVLEIVENYHGDTYRAVYTVRNARGYLCAPLLQEEIEAWHQDAEARH